MLVATKQRLSAAANQQFPLLVGFDSNPNPSIQNVGHTHVRHFLNLGGWRQLSAFRYSRTNGGYVL